MKKNKRYIIKIFGILVYLLVTLTVCASATPTITSIATNPDQPLAGEPFSVIVTTQNAENSDYFNVILSNDSMSLNYGPYPFLLTESSGIKTGKATMPNVIINETGAYTLDVTVIGREWNGDVTDYTTINVINNSYLPIQGYPTIAVPVAAILGVIFIFGRRKA
jgi:hypothetical protein